MAQDAQQRTLRGVGGARRAMDLDAVRISSNENPLGPCKEGLEAIFKVAPNPGYGGGAPEFIGSKVTRVPLRADHSHDVQAMIKADPNCGVYYVCNPNNPSGTLERPKISSICWPTRRKTQWWLSTRVGGSTQ